MTSLENKKLLSEKDDTDFIHLATNEQIPKIASKYFKNKNYIILKLEFKRLHGNLITKLIPGGYGGLIIFLNTRKSLIN